MRTIEHISTQWRCLLRGHPELSALTNSLHAWVKRKSTKPFSSLIAPTSHNHPLSHFSPFPPTSRPQTQGAALLSDHLRLPNCFIQSFCCCLVIQSTSDSSVSPWTAACQASLSLTISRSLPKFMFIASVMPSSYLILWDPLLLLPLMFPSIRDFSNESSVCIRWSKHWSFSFSISPSSKYSVLISLKIDWFNLFAGQGTFRSLPAPQFEGIHSLAFWTMISIP